MFSGWEVRARACALTAALALVLGGAVAPAHAGEWLAGDLHVHTTFSHDSYGGPADDNTGPEELYTLGFPVSGSFALAASRGLDFLAITDHNDVRSQRDPGFGSGGVLGIPGYENSLSGHAQMLGARRVYEKPADTRSAEQVQAHADALRADGGVFQVNHPVDSSTDDDPDDLDWALGHAVRPDTVEAWNSSYLVQPPLPVGNSHDDAVRYWERWLDRGERVALTGGSDSHWIASSFLQGPGQPTTWVYAAERSVAGVLEGLRRGRTFVAHQPPAHGGPRLLLEADGDGDGRFEALVGDRVPAGARARVRVLGAPATRIRLVTDGGRQLGRRIDVGLSRRFTHRFKVPSGSTWVRAELLVEDLQRVRQGTCPRPLLQAYCRNRLGVLAMTSALFVGS